MIFKLILAKYSTINEVFKVTRTSPGPGKPESAQGNGVLANSPGQWCPNCVPHCLRDPWLCEMCPVVSSFILCEYHHPTMIGEPLPQGNIRKIGTRYLESRIFLLCVFYLSVCATGCVEIVSLSSNKIKQNNSCPKASCEFTGALGTIKHVPLFAFGHLKLPRYQLRVYYLSGLADIHKKLCICFTIRRTKFMGEKVQM